MNKGFFLVKPKSAWLVLFLVGLLLVGGFFLLKNKKIYPASQKSFQPFQRKISSERRWEFSPLDRSGQVLAATKITFSLVSGEKTNQIYIKNKPVRTTPENAFLILSLELKNDTSQRVYFYSSDFVRLATPEGKKFEADFKNPRFEIAPLSTKKDKLAFLVNGKENNFEIQIGEIAGEKETIDLSF